MNIIDERLKSGTPFKYLHVGDMFIAYGDYYVRIRTRYSDDVKCNSLNLIDYELYYFHDDQAVTKVEADLHIK